MKTLTFIMCLMALSVEVNAQYITSSPPGPDYCAFQNVEYTYSSTNPNNIVTWYVDDYGPYSSFGAPVTMQVGMGNTLVIQPFQYSPAIRVRAKETDINNNPVYESWENSTLPGQSTIPVYYSPTSCGSLDAAPPYDGWGGGQRWSMWYLDGVETGLTFAHIEGPFVGGQYVFKFKPGCSNDTISSASINVFGISTPQITASGPTTFCDGDSVTLTVEPGFSVWNWQKNGVGIPGTSGVLSLKVKATGNYAAQVYTQTGGGNCFQITPAMQVTANPSAIITAVSTACAGDTVILTCTPAISYQWKRYGTDIQGATSQTYQTTVSGNFSVTTTGLTCNTSNMHNLQFYAKPSNVAISQSGPISLCKYESLSLNVTGNNISSWSWLRNNIPMPGSNTPTIVVTKSGNYKCIVFNAIGCSKTTAVANISSPVATDLPSKSITLKPGSSGTDSYTTSAFGNIGTNFGNTTTMEVSAWYKYFRTAERGYIRFDLSAIPQNSPVLTATLKLFADTSVVYQNGNQSFFVNRLTESWLENTITWNTFPASTEFQSSSVPINSALSNSVVSVSVTDMVRHWMFLPSQNYGFLLHLQENTSLSLLPGWMSFYSGDHPDASNRPKLTVKYAYADIIENGPLSFCSGGNVTFTTNLGYNYQWYKNNQVIPGANSSSFTATSAGDYYVIISNGGGCSVQSATKTVLVPCREIMNQENEIDIIYSHLNSELKFLLPASNGVISVYDIAGRLVMNYTCNEQECLMSTLKFYPGIYLVQVVSGNQAKTKKVIVE